MLDLREGATEEQLENQVAKAQEQLLALKRQQDLIERQKRELEELSRKQAEFEDGKADIVEKLTRSLGIIERQSYETQKRYEQLNATRESFLQHLGTLEALDSRNWDKANLAKELPRALGLIDEARADYAKGRSRLNAEAPVEVIREEGEPDEAASAEGTFLYWLKAGFAFTLPLLILGVIFLVIMLTQSAF
jgi:DNA repair exonuclease SbcCD ATPase subunit